MRDLNAHEVQCVSGGWVFADIGSGLGYIVGSIIDLGATAGGLKTTAKSSFQEIGSGIGKMLELNLSGAINDIGKGVSDTLKCGVKVIDDIRGSSSSSS